MGPETNNPETVTQPEARANSQMAEQGSDGVKQNIQDKTETIPEVPENNRTSPRIIDEPVVHEYATPRELALLSTVFTIATFMIAIDGSILGRKLLHFASFKS